MAINFITGDKKKQVVTPTNPLPTTLISDETEKVEITSLFHQILNEIKITNLYLAEIVGDKIEGNKL